MEIHRLARRHGINDPGIRHALEHAITVFDLEPDADSPKALAIDQIMPATCWRSSGSSSTKSDW